MMASGITNDVVGVVQVTGADIGVVRGMEGGCEQLPVIASSMAHNLIKIVF